MKDQRLYLRDILERIQLIHEFTQEGRQAFDASRKTQEAVIRCLEVIGEIVKRLPPELLQAAPHIPWRQVTGLRDVLIHDYDKVDLDEIWFIIEDDLVPMREAIEIMLKSLQQGDDKTKG